MFFESSYYASPHIEDLLKKDDVQLIEFLDDDEILQEYKSQNKNLVQFFQRPDIVEQLVTMIITEPPGDVPDAVRFKHPNVACEILTTETPDMTERLIENEPVLQKLYSFLEQDAPLNPLLTSFFSKTFGMLIVKKTEQNWFAYQCVCIQVLEFIKTRERFLETMFKHVGTPAIMDLLFQIIVNVEGPDLKNNLFNWLNEQNMVPRLINILGCDSDPEKHHNVAQFICDLIQHSRSFRQADLVERGAHRQQDDAGMSLLHALEAPMVTNSLLEIVLMDANRESTILAGIRIVLKLLEKPVINERDVSIAQMVQQSEDEHRKRLLDRLLPQVAHRIRDFHHLLLNPPARPAIQNTAALLQPPFGHTRLQVCSMLTVLLRTENAAIERAICKTDFFVTLMELFRTYCWNNLLHNQVRTCLVYALTPSAAATSELPISALHTHIIAKCKIVTNLIDCWKYNNEQVKPTQKRGARLGYMGQLIDILAVVTAACRSHDAYRALVEDSLTAEQLADWHTIAGTPAPATPAGTVVNLANLAATEHAVPETNSFADVTVGPAEISTDEAAIDCSEPAIANFDCSNDLSMSIMAEPPPAVATPKLGELAAELKLQQTLLAGIDPYEKNESIFLTTEYDQDFSVDPEASERFAQACKSKDINSANIDDILSDMLNIDDCDLFAMNDDDDDDDDDDEDDDNNTAASNHHNLHRDYDYDRGGSGSGSDDDYAPTHHRMHRDGGGFNVDDDDEDDDDDDDDDDDGDDNDVHNVDDAIGQHDAHNNGAGACATAAAAAADDDDNRTHRRQRHHRLTAQQQHRRPPTAATAAATHRSQLIIESGDDNANVHGIDNLKFTSSFDISPWDTQSGAVAAAIAATVSEASNFFSNEVNFQAHFPDLSVPEVSSASSPSAAAAAAASSAMEAAFDVGAVSAVFDPVDPFGAFCPVTGSGGAEVPFVFDASVAFGDVCHDPFAEQPTIAAVALPSSLPANVAPVPVPVPVAVATVLQKATVPNGTDVPVVRQNGVAAANGVAEIVVVTSDGGPTVDDKFE